MEEYRQKELFEMGKEAESYSKQPQPKIIVHIDEPKWVPIRNSVLGTYQDSNLWGKIVTNKANRTHDRFAVWFEKKGRHVHYLTKDDFDYFAPWCIHEYRHTGLTPKGMKLIWNMMQSATTEQLGEIKGTAAGMIVYRERHSQGKPV